MKEFTYHFKMNDGRLVYGDGSSAEEAARDAGVDLDHVKRFMPVKFLFHKAMTEETKTQLRERRKGTMRHEKDEARGPTEAEGNDRNDEKTEATVTKEKKIMKTKSNAKKAVSKKAVEAKGGKRAGNVKAVKPVKAAVKAVIDHKDPKAGNEFTVTFKGKEYTLKVIKGENGAEYKVGKNTFNSPSGAAKSITENQVNGWKFWKISK